VDIPSWKYVLNVAALVTRIVPPSLCMIPSPSATAVVPTVAPPSIRLISAPVAVRLVPPRLIASAAKLSIFAVPSINKSLNSREEVPKSISLSTIGTIAPSCILICCTAAEDTST